MIAHLPLNRVVAFFGPIIAVVAGALADWLLTTVHVLGDFRLGHDEVTNAIVQMLTFTLTTAVVFLGQQKWLSGWISFESEQAGEK